MIFGYACASTEAQDLDNPRRAGNSIVRARSGQIGIRRRTIAASNPASELMLASAAAGSRRDLAL